jgi:hypothetical protein
MTRPPLVLVLVLVLVLAPRPALAAPGDDARDAARAARQEGGYTFCSAPSKAPLGKQWSMCTLAEEVDGCEAFVRACGDRIARKEDEDRHGLLDGLARVLGRLAQLFAFALVAVIVLVVAIPVVLAIAKARRDRQLGDRAARANAATPLAPPPPEAQEIAGAEAALRAAEDHARRGELDRALALYLAASLSALDHRGAIRIAKHRTNGEYVRACTEAGARQPLREIVREVDRAVFGKVAPTRDAVAEVASRATRLVRAAAAAGAMALALLLAGCGGLDARAFGGGRSDPSSDDLPIDVLRRSGFTVAHLDTSLATLPMPGEENAPRVVLAADVALDEEAEAHLLRWVEAGGVLVLMAQAAAWPKELEAKHEAAPTRDLVVDDDDDAWGRAVRVRGARVAHAQAIVWRDAQPVAKLGTQIYAARKPLGDGAVLGVANADLFTNLSAARPDNAAALVTLLRRASDARDIRVAGRADGVQPPSNPIASLVSAGLGKGAAHALVACLLLFLAVGVRQARARPAAAPTRRAFAEHVEATGAFYGRARAHAHALAAYGRFVEVRLRERLPRGADPIALLASRAGAPREEVARAYVRATEARPEDAARGDELTTIRDLRAIVAKALET